MKILIVAATPFEILPLSQHLDQSFDKIDANQYKRDATVVDILVTGVGIHATVYNLTKKIIGADYELIINAGIAGAKKTKLNKGDVVNVVSEQFGDVGIQEADGSFRDIFELELSNPNQLPFKDGVMRNEIASDFQFLPLAKGITVNTVHGNVESIAQFNRKYDYDVETMEGAAFFFVCIQQQQQHFLQIRSISNFVEERNKANWDIEGSITKLNSILIELITIFC